MSAQPAAIATTTNATTAKPAADDNPAGKRVLKAFLMIVLAVLLVGGAVFMYGKITEGGEVVAPGDQKQTPGTDADKTKTAEKTAEKPAGKPAEQPDTPTDQQQPQQQGDGTKTDAPTSKLARFKTMMQTSRPAQIAAALTVVLLLVAIVLVGWQVATYLQGEDSLLGGLDEYIQPVRDYEAEARAAIDTRQARIFGSLASFGACALAGAGAILLVLFCVHLFKASADAGGDLEEELKGLAKAQAKFKGAKEAMSLPLLIAAGVLFVVGLGGVFVTEFLFADNWFVPWLAGGLTGAAIALLAYSFKDSAQVLFEKEGAKVGVKVLAGLVGVLAIAAWGIIEVSYPLASPLLSTDHVI